MARTADSVKARDNGVAKSKPPAKMILITAPPRKRPFTEQELKAKAEKRSLTEEEKKASEAAAEKWWKDSKAAFKKTIVEFMARQKR
jgi:hypothetical protein